MTNFKQFLAGSAIAAALIFSGLAVTEARFEANTIASR